MLLKKFKKIVCINHGVIKNLNAESNPIFVMCCYIDQNDVDTIITKWNHSSVMYRLK